MVNVIASPLQILLLSIMILAHLNLEDLGGKFFDSSDINTT